MKPLQIVSQPDDLDQGLFGQVFYYLLQVLPYLHRHGIYPAWDVRAKHYGELPDCRTVPGALDLAYDPPRGPYRTIHLFELRRRHAHILGNDWVALNRLWCSYFKVPQRILLRADKAQPKGRILGIHYRGTDKQTAAWDSNPISQDQYIALIQDFLEHRPEFDGIVAASDESSFIEKFSASIPLPTVSLGEVEFHMATEQKISRTEKTDRAVLDCVLFSRCDCLIETSSALPSFAKLLNPNLEVYRCAASKLFGKLYTNTPYFPVAHIPHLPVANPASLDILRSTMEQDWTYEPHTAKYRDPFVSLPRWPINNTLYTVAEKLRVDKLVARVLSGHY